MQKIIMIASSTGGPKALRSVIPRLPKSLDFIIVIIQHMPKGFTSSLADSLKTEGGMHVEQAVDGMQALPGHVYIAEGGKQLTLKQKFDRIYICEEEEKEGRILKPCADVTLESLAKLKNIDLTCIVMTGMGKDGKAGIIKLKESIVKKNEGEYKLWVIGQDEKSCVVYGMPKAVAEAGLCDEVVSLKDMVKKIIQIAEKK
ncbi:MAG TPA: hypothetical protein DEO62_05210 [Lachnospiraceae bacterium]|jgi:two-component system chemotaxis response regulator CheB|nr:hypothetical protein [Lachnospiraceae bacterium]HBR04963.1 hypothetical protein [Lachnospiraceae bacterium]HBZ90399.1 hypothetical protein [Lachnospiraceae bacterium]